MADSNGNNNDNDGIKTIIFTAALIASTIANCLVYCFFHREQSLYFSLLKLISLFEISFIYSKYLIIVKDFALIKNIKKNFDKVGKVVNFLTFEKFKGFDFPQYNEYFYNSMKRVYFIINIFLCIETINLITRPFSQSKKKTNIYYALSFLVIIVSFLLEKFLNKKIAPEYIDLGLYGLFVLAGIISIIFVIIRFCLHKPLIQSAKNFFVMRHIIYIIVLSGIYVNELKWLDYHPIVPKAIILSLGFVMSFIKITDQLFVKDKNAAKRKKKKGVTSLITSNLNVEFMCCILYGMTDVFMKNYNKKASKKNSVSKDRKTHTIKYLNTIDSKIEDIKDIKMHVSQLGESLVNTKNDNEESNLDNSNTFTYTNTNLNVSDKSNSKTEDALIIEYSPETFNELRTDDDISDEVMIKAFSPSKNKSAIEKMSESKGKSGSFFFYSHDRKFIIKTITGDEKNTLLNILHDYFNYIKNHKTTLITKIYGIYTLVIKNASSVNIILMQNLFGCSPIHIQRMFDLKGSKVQRKTKDVQKWRRDQVLKDLDFQWLTKVERKLINFKEDDIKQIKKTLFEDISFYKSLSLMDYSLLLIIIDFPNNIDPDYKQILYLLEDPKYRGHVYKSENENYIYIIGIIDYLQEYNFKKKMEHCLKGIIYGKEKNMVSAVEPEYYGKRFNDFMKNNVFVVGEK